MTSRWIAISAIVLAAAVGLGAFGAHGLRDKLDTYYMAIFEKAVFYQFIHGLGILLVAILGHLALINPLGAGRICWAFLLGIVLFSGSLYFLVLLNQKILGAITPFGGTAFIAGWLMLFYEAVKSGRG